MVIVNTPTGSAVHSAAASDLGHSNRGDAAGLEIGEVASIVGVATSALRYYERRELVVADTRVYGRRRYEPATVRRLVFVQMLQDAGLSLDEIQGVLDADDNAAWKAIVLDRRAQLDIEIERLEHARELLDGALLCRFDHPLDECRIMNDEIEQRLGVIPSRP